MLHKVFVYGTLRRGWGNHRLLNKEDVQFLGPTYTQDKYVMRHNGGFPNVSKERSLDYIRGEVYLVDDETFRSLDMLEGYPRHYNREVIHTQDLGTAWMYHYEQEPTDLPLVEGGDWANASHQRG